MKSINEIKRRKYEGYVWYSDEREPRKVLTGEEFSFDEAENANPFVIEALLYDRENEISVIVKHTGRHIVSEIDLKNLPEGAVLSDVKKFYPHRLGDNILKVNFQQLWIPETDENCDGMKVLNLKAIVFTGLDLKKNK